MSRNAYGKYQLIAEIGRGGMAEVFLAVTSASSFSKLVVIKKLREHLAADTEFVSMLVDEGRIAGLLNHPNLVQTIEVGESSGEIFLTMEYLDGQPLHKIIRSGGQTFSLGMHLNILADVLSGMHYAHELADLDGTPLNIVHRDVTPHNVFVTYQGVTKVVDFGIAKAVGRATETRHGVVKGKAAYMAPEQATGADVDRRADLFTIGVMLYEAAVARRMWKGVSELNILCSLVGGKIRASPKALVPTVDDELDRICQRALAWSADERYATAEEMERDVRAYLAAKRLHQTPQEIGAYVSRLFSEKRAMTHKVIERQLAQVRATASAPVPALPRSASMSTSMSSPKSRDHTGTSQSISSTSSIIAASPSGSSLMHTMVADQPPPRPAAQRTRPPPPVRSDRGWMLAMALIALAITSLTAAATIFAFRPSPEPEPVAVRGAPPPTKPITVTLRATPLETQFWIDDGPPLDNPYIGMFPRDRRQHLVRAAAPGYPPKQTTVTFADDVSLRFALSLAGHAGK